MVSFNCQEHRVFGADAVGAFCARRLTAEVKAVGIPALYKRLQSRQPLPAFTPAVQKRQVSNFFTSADS